MSRNRRQVLAAGLFLILVLFLLTAFRVAVVRGDSMLPTYRNGQMVLVSRLSWLRGPWHRGDVALVRIRDGARADVLIKRIYKLPGDTLTYDESRPYRRISRYLEPTKDPEAPVRIPGGYVLVLGDNAAVSDDSRTLGTIPVTDLIGKVMNAPPAR